MGGSDMHPQRSVCGKVVAILRSFGSGGSLNVTEIAQVADLPLSTAHRLVRELAGWGVLRRGVDGRYQLGDRYLGGTACSSDLWPVAAPVVEDLSELTRSDVRLGLLQCLRVRYAEKAHGYQPLSAFSTATLPAHATALGKALLAFSPPGTVEHVIRHGLGHYTSATITTAARLRRVLKITKLRGMAVARGELLLGHSAVAVPVFGSAGELVAALEVRLREVPGELARVGPALTIAARGLSRDLRQPPPTAAARPTRRSRTQHVIALPGSTEPIPERAIRITDVRHRREQPAVARPVHRDRLAIQED